MSPDDLTYPQDDNETEFVPAVFARDAEEAQRYCELLADHGIVGIVANDGVAAEDAEVRSDVGEGIGMTRGVAVLVEDTMLDEAGLVIADREDIAEFRFDEDDEAEDDEDELDFAQGIDSELDDEDVEADDAEDIEVDDADMLPGGYEGSGGDTGEDEVDNGLDDELNNEFEEY